MGGMSMAAVAAAAASQNKPEIPVVNVPDYPDRVLPRRVGGLKSIVSAVASKQGASGLSAPAQDISSSGPYNFPYPSTFYRLLHHTNY